MMLTREELERIRTREELERIRRKIMAALPHHVYMTLSREDVSALLDHIAHLESLLRRFCKHFKDCDDCPIWEEATCPMPTALLRDFTDAAIEGRE